jgi:hypothetical protein
MVQRIFMGYDHQPPTNRDTLHRACSKLNEMGDYDARSWEDLRPGGRLIIKTVLSEIDEADLALFDITTINPNVLFELGYAIAHRCRVGIICESSNTSFKDLFKNFGLLRGVGYVPWQDSGSLVASVTKGDFSSIGEVLGDELIRSSAPYSESSLFFLPTLNRSEADSDVRSVVHKSAERGSSVIYADPAEARLEPLSWYASKAYSCTATLLHFESPRRNGHRLHNSRLALVGGMAHGYGRPILMQSDQDYEVPFDYEDLLKQYGSAGQAKADASEWLDSLDLKPTDPVRKVQLSLDVELRDLNFGEHVAENEIRQLPDYFIETAEYREVKTAHLCVFVGRKGTGKSANLYLAAADLRRNPENLVVIIRPATYDFSGLVEMMTGLSSASRTHTVEGIWKLLLLSEVARTVVDEIRAQPAHVPDSDAQEAFLDGIESAPFDLEADFGNRVTSTLRALSGLDLDEIPQSDRREVLNEALHAEWIARLRQLLGPVVANRSRIAILIDNLDKGWERSADLNVLSDLLLGLLSATGRVERDIERAIPGAAAPPVSLGLFLRSDIFAYVKERAREPDKILTKMVEWSDPAVLRRVVEERFLASRPAGSEPSELWSKFFCETVDSQETSDYLLERVLPRPRDLIFLCNVATGVAINRRHNRIEADDIKTAEETYSQFAFEALLVENGITVDDFQSVLLEFLGAGPILEKGEILDTIRRAGVIGIDAERVFHRLKAVSFFGIEVGEGRFDFPEVGKAMEKAEVGARNHATSEGATRHLVHPAYRRFLEIADPRTPDPRG